MWQPWFQIHPETTFDDSSQQIVPLSRTSDHVDLFSIGFDNAVWSTWWEAGPGWQPWFQIHKEIVFDRSRQQVAAVSTSPGRVDLFVIGFDNAVWTTSWEAGPGWRPWTQIHKETTFDHTTQRMVALSRTPGHIDLFVIGFDNAVWSTWWEQAPGWQKWFQIHQETKFDHTTQQLVAISPNPGHVDLFVIGFDNTVWSTWWEQAPGWQKWFQIRKETTFDHTAQRVAAVSRTPGHVDLFVIGFDNAVWSTWWEKPNGWQPWFQIYKNPVFDHTRQSVAAVSRNSNHVDLFVVGSDNTVWSTWWEQASGWQPWFQVHPETVFDHTHEHIRALCRASDHVDLFLMGFDNAAWSTWWGPDPPGRGQVSSDGSTVIFDSGPVVSDEPLGGSVRVVMDRKGSFTFTAHAHDSGFDNIDYAIGAVVLASNGIAFTFGHAGHTEGTIAGLPFGTPDRDDWFTTGGVNQQITTEWDQLVNGVLSVKLTGQDTLPAGIEGMITDLLKQALQEAGKAAGAAVVALVV